MCYLDLSLFPHDINPSPPLPFLDYRPTTSQLQAYYKPTTRVKPFMSSVIIILAKVTLPLSPLDTLPHTR